MYRSCRSTVLLLCCATAAFLALAAPAAAHHDAKHTDNTTAFCERKLENGKEHMKCSVRECGENEFRDPVDGQCKSCLDLPDGCPTQRMSAAQTTTEQFAAVAGVSNAQASASFTYLSLHMDPIPLRGAYYRATYYDTYPQVVITVDGVTTTAGCDESPGWVGSYPPCYVNGRQIL